MIYLQLFLSFAQIGLFSIGGGYAALPLIQAQIVNVHGWMDMTQFVDVITISQMTPGPIAINAATFVGIKVAGLPGAITATIGSVTPSCIIVLILATVYYKFRNLDTIKGILSGLRPAVVALIASAGLSIVILTIFKNGQVQFTPDNLDFIAIVLFGISLFVLRKFKLNPIYVMLSVGVVGMVVYGVVG